MIATLVRRLDRWRDRFDLIVVDESHHSVAGTWARSWRHSQEGTCWA
jgi:superfamily II DNA or RNA helicase